MEEGFAEVLPWDRTDLVQTETEVGAAAGCAFEEGVVLGDVVQDAF